MKSLVKIRSPLGLAAMLAFVAAADPELGAVDRSIGVGQPRYFSQAMLERMAS